MGADYHQFMITATAPNVFGDDYILVTDEAKAALWADLTDRIKATLAEDTYKPLNVQIVVDLSLYEE